ncbi:S24 family peptidase [Caulobacter segnis]|jgi:phage repressor protein C with HTH and peptisase S24 domain|uniref:S24 family peptidase n=1 Tax=Caulobacter segnis TaxID=88688 RepID=UPI001CBDE22E|nr:helix-turn-helix transcriptional regulator [Caulobacter segnis]UAL10789.1 helix-turn-helix transcriptional regulator [Caulobacter segnis]
MATLSHGEIWRAIDALAERFDMTPSAMARMAGLDPTSFNRSKRGSTQADSRPRWPSTESLAKLLEATGVNFSEFAALTEQAPVRAPGRPSAPLLGLAQAAQDGFFDEAGMPVGKGWDEAPAPDLGEGLFALEVSGDGLAPVYRDGDRLLVSPTVEPRKGDRVVARTAAGEVLVREMGRVTARTIELLPLDRSGDDRLLSRDEVAWIARIVWVSQ